MTGNQDLFQQAMNQGHSAAWDQNWERAVVLYQQALDEFPTHPKALTSLGLALLELKRYEDSLRCYSQAARAVPDDPLPVEKVSQVCERIGRLNDAIEASLRAADLFLKRNDAERAIECWIRVLRFNSEHLQAHSRLAVVYERLGRKPEAVVEYLAIASLMQHAGDLGKALQAVQHTLQLMPESSEARQALGMLRSNQMLPKPPRVRGGTGPVLMAQVRLMDGVQPAELPAAGGRSAGGRSAGGQDPIMETRQVALIQLAGSLFEAGEEKIEIPEPPRRDLDSIITGTSTPEPEQSSRSQMLFHLGQAIDSQTRSQDDQAAAHLEKSIQFGLTHPAAFYVLGHRLIQNGAAAENLEAGVGYLQQITRSPDFVLAARLLLGQAFRKLNRLPEAAVEYLEALKIADSQVVPPDQADELRQLYEPLIDNQTNQSDAKALDELCQNVATQLVQPDWRAALVKARSQLPAQPMGTPPLPLAELLLAISSSKVIESMANVRALSTQGFSRTAVEEAYNALKYAPTYLPLHIQIGELLLADQRSQDAIDKFGVVSHVYHIRGEFEQASRLLRRIIQLAPMDLAARGKLIDLLVSCGKVDQALKEYSELADLYYRVGELDIARKTYMTALRLCPQSTTTRTWSIQILNRVGDIDMQRLDWRQALRIFEQLRTLQPEDEKLRTHLIDLNFRMSQDGAAMSELESYLTYLQSAGSPEQAIQFVNALVQERPDKPELHKRLARVYQDAGRLKDAVSEYDRAGDLLVTAGNMAAAAGVIETILTLNPPNIADYKKLLAQLKDKPTS
jgi:tetratricopeptide (TPR) repeat protein